MDRLGKTPSLRGPTYLNICGQCCFVTYEGAAEALVSLFVPFYDEFKSLLLMFLILTRARVRTKFFIIVLDIDADTLGRRTYILAPHTTNPQTVHPYHGYVP